MKKIIVLLTTCLLLISSLAGVVSAQDASQLSALAAESYPDLDYSMGANKYGTTYMGDVLEQLLGKQLTEQEKNAIRDEFPGQNVLTYKRPSIVNPQISYDGELGELSVVVMKDYIFDAAYDYEIYWTPARLVVGGQSARFEPAADVGEGYYRAAVRGIAWSSNVLMTVEYTSEFVISGETLNDFVNFAYDTAVSLTDDYQIYQTALEQYRFELNAYHENQEDWTRYREEMDAYRDHLDKVALYQDYLLCLDYWAEMEIYDAEYAEYTANAIAWSTYRDLCEKYAMYLAYKNHYPELYQTYQSELSMAQYQLSLLELMDKKDPVTGKSFMDTTLDDRIGQVIVEKREQLSVLEESAVDAVVESTPIIQNFCETYRSLESDQERYVYYIRQYSTLIKHLKQLYDGVYKLYKNGIVYATLEKEYPDYIPAMLRMLGSLYVINNTLNDKLLLDPDFEIDYHGHQTVAELVDPSLRPAVDTNQAKPYAAWPTPPEDPESCEVTSEPVAPTIVLEAPEKPALPEFGVITSPDEMSADMQDPGTMDEPLPPAETVAHPGTPPALPWNATLVALYDAYLQGLITERELFGAPQTVTLTAAANHSAVLDRDERFCLVHFYNSDEQQTYLGYDYVLRGEAGEYPAELALPTIKAVGEHSFVFDGWVYENGEPADLSVVSDNIEVYASYRPIPRECIVTWNVGDQPITQVWPYGSTPEFDGSTDKSPSAEFIYTFTGWDKEFGAIYDDVTYTAQYSTEPNRHKVVFVMGDGSTIEKEYVYGKDLSDAVPLQKPVKAPDAQYTYTFAGWQDEQGNKYTYAWEFPLLTGPMTFTAAFDTTVNTYTVTWIVDGVSTKEVYEYGTMPVYPGTDDGIPTLPPTETLEQEFRGWDHELSAVTGDATYVARFETVTRKFTVNFVIGDQTIPVRIEYGSMAQFEGIPQRDADAQYEYEFVAWDREFEQVTEDTEYVACFKKTLRKHPVTFVVGDRSVTAEFAYGTTPSYPNGTPAIPFDETYYYRFSGWDQALAPVDGTPVTYTACFEPVPLAPTSDGGVGQMSGDASGRYELSISAKAADLSAVFDVLGEAGAQVLQVRFGDAVLEFPKAQIDAFYQMSGAISKVSMSKGTHGAYEAYTIELLDANGAPIQFLMTELTVMLPYSGLYSADVYHVEDDGAQKKLDSKHEDGYLVFSTMDFSTFVIMDKYSITGNAPENGDLNLAGEAYEGDTVTFTPDPNKGYVIDSVVVLANGQEVEVKAENGVYSFVMPEGNVQVNATFKIVEGGTTVEVIVGVVTALLIVSMGIVILIVVKRRKPVRM